MNENLRRVITCPFCGYRNVARVPINVICCCGAKYYISDNTFWDRKTGKIVNNPPFTYMEVSDDKKQ